jgi:hypothetical protein
VPHVFRKCAGHQSVTSRYKEKMKNNHRVINLLQDFDLVNPDLASILRDIREIVFSIAPNIEEKVMYGGIIFTIPDRMFCGLFLRKNHVSVEFDLGYLLDDPDKHLEGSGKYRRHLKISTRKDMITKKVKNYILQSFKL